MNCRTIPLIVLLFNYEGQTLPMWLLNLEEEGLVLWSFQLQDVKPEDCTSWRIELYFNPENTDLIAKASALLTKAKIAFEKKHEKWGEGIWLTCQFRQQSHIESRVGRSY